MASHAGPFEVVATGGYTFTTAISESGSVVALFGDDGHTKVELVTLFAADAYALADLLNTSARLAAGEVPYV